MARDYSHGNGCAKCKQLTANAETAASSLALAYEVEKVTDTNAMIDTGVMRTPELAIDGDIVIVIEGKAQSLDDIKALLS